MSQSCREVEHSEDHRSPSAPQKWKAYDQEPFLWNDVHGSQVGVGCVVSKRWGNRVTIRVNDSPKNLDCEGEEISGGDVDSRKVCSAQILDR